jgi:hypothetical protein
VEPVDKSVNITEEAQRFVGNLCSGLVLKILHKEVSDDRRERGARGHSICLLVELSTNGEVLRSEDMPNKAKMSSRRCWLRRRRSVPVHFTLFLASLSFLLLSPFHFYFYFRFVPSLPPLPLIIYQSLLSLLFLKRKWVPLNLLYRFNFSLAYHEFSRYIPQKTVVTL